MSKLRLFFKNVTYSLIANALNLIVSAATSLLVPYLLGDGIDQYGYFQIYLFYVAYIGFFHFGLCDGALLLEGGKDYKTIDKQKYCFQYHFLFISEFVISFFILLFLFLLHKDADYLFIGLAFCVNLIIFLPRNLLAYLLQASNRIKENSFITIIGRTIYLICILLLLWKRQKNYKYIVISDLFGKVCALIYAVYKCRDIVFSKPSRWSVGFSGIRESIGTGIKLMFAGISSMIITGMVRLAIQYKWDVVIYGKVSLILSITNLVLTFISAMAIVLYPTLRSVGNNRAVSLYVPIKEILMTLLLFSLVICYPLQLVILRILPQYADSLVFLPILFPVCIYSAKFTLLIQTYMQVFRMEKKVLQVNIITIIVSFFLTIFSVFILKNLTISIITILITSAFRSILSEFVISKRIGVKPLFDVLFETVYVVLFVLISYYASMKMGMVIILPVFILYFLFKKKAIIRAFKLINKE